MEVDVVVKVGLAQTKRKVENLLAALADLNCLLFIRLFLLHRTVLKLRGITIIINQEFIILLLGLWLIELV